MYDYLAGKLDWLAYGLPVERSDPVALTILDQLYRNVPTARITETVGEFRSRLKDRGKFPIPVVNDQNILLGLIDTPFKDIDPTTPISELMNPGPMTVRPFVTIASAEDRLTKQHLEAALVTSSDGKLMGIFHRNSRSSDGGLPATGIWD